MSYRSHLMAMTAAVALAAPGAALAADGIPVGHIVDYTGPTSDVGASFGGSIHDTMQYINTHGGINGKPLLFETTDYAYQAPEAVSNYRRMVSQDNIVAMQGWGTADTEALVDFVRRDKIPYWSASYSGTLTDPTGEAPRSTKSAPYNFFYGPSYSDGCRALVQWAAEDWKAKGGEGQAKFVHMGDNHPFPNSPKAACAEYAEELGLEVLDPITVTLRPGDFTPQCLTLRQQGADYAYLANTGGSHIALMKACETAEVETQFMAGVWGFDANVARAAGEAADGTVFAVRTSTVWTDDAPGMEVVRAIAAEAGREGYQLNHYITGICSTFYMKEAMEWADANGGITGENIRQGMYEMSAAADMQWVPKGLDGVCQPSGWSETDHRGTMSAYVYRASVSGSTDNAEIDDLLSNGTISLERQGQVVLERRPEWLGY